MDEKKNGHNDQPEIPTLLAENNMPQALISGNIDSGNPGAKLIQNDDKLAEMLKAFYFRDDEFGRNVAEALGECDEFLIDTEGDNKGKPNKGVLLRIEWVKYLCSALGSVGGRLIQAYLDGATGIRTTAFTERGWQLFSLTGRPRENDNDSGNKQSGSRRP